MYQRQNRTVTWTCLTVLVLLLSTACSEHEGGDRLPDHAVGESMERPGGDRQTAFRVRTDFATALNSDDGWAGPINESATVFADQPFRLRFEIEAAADDAPRGYRLESRRNGGDWTPLLAEDFPQPAKVLELPLDAIGMSESDGPWTVVRGNRASLSWPGSAEDRQLAIATEDQPLLVMAGESVRWQPVEFAAELRLEDDTRSRAGLVFDYRSDDDFSLIDLALPDSVRVLRRTGGSVTVLADHRVPLPRGRWIELKTVFDEREIEFELEFDGEALVFSIDRPVDFAPRPGLFLPEQARAEVRELVIEGEPRTPISSIVTASAFDYGEASEDLLDFSERPFTGGVGVSFGRLTPPWTSQGGHGEWEFPIVIRRFADEAAMSEAGDRFDYRLVRDGHGPLDTEVIASVIVEVADGHLGGTFVETPMRLGPWQANTGDLYFPMEPAETWNALMMVKSLDGGRSWREMDGANRPATGDLEGFASVLAGDRIHMLHQTSDDVWYHVFNTADHRARPDQWAIRDERLASPPEPPTQVADLAVRSDGSVVAVYGGPDSIRLRMRDVDGLWSEERVIRAPSVAFLSGPGLVLGRDDIVHLAYTGNDGSAWYRRIMNNDEISEPVRFAEDLATGSEDVGSILPLVHLSESDRVSLIYRGRDGRLRERRVSAEGTWSEAMRVSDRVVAQNPVDSDQTAADAVVDGERIHLLFVEQGSGQLFHSTRDEQGWSEPEQAVGDASIQWVRGSVYRNASGQRVLGFIYDAGSEGGSGLNRFGQRPLSVP